MELQVEGLEKATLTHLSLEYIAGVSEVILGSQHNLVHFGR